MITGYLEVQERPMIMRKRLHSSIREMIFPQVMILTRIPFMVTESFDRTKSRILKRVGLLYARLMYKLRIGKQKW